MQLFLMAICSKLCLHFHLKIESGSHVKKSLPTTLQARARLQNSAIFKPCPLCGAGLQGRNHKQKQSARKAGKTIVMVSTQGFANPVPTEDNSKTTTLLIAASAYCN